MAKRKTESQTVVMKYVDGILSGKIPACKLHRQCVDRFVNDLQKKSPYIMNWSEADRYIRAAGLCTHYQGRRFVGTRLKLEPFQMFCDANIFGWKRRDNGFRRFRKAYIKWPRKTGKSFYAGSAGVRVAFLDGEGAPEVFTAATTRDQAKIPFKMISQIIRRNESLARRVKVRKNDIGLNDGGLIMPVSSEANTLDGKNPHFALIDEIHAHKTSAVADVLESGTGFRDQPLILLITSGGTLVNGFDEQMMEAARRVLDPASQINEDSTFYFVAGIDEGDDWQTEAAWKKANPNLGVTVSLDYYASMYKSVLAGSLSEAEFRTKFLSETLNSSERWLPLDEWDACKAKIDFEDLRNRPCYGGLDLSKTRDLTAFALVWLIDGMIIVKVWFWCPRDNAVNVEKQNHAAYVQWASKGYMELTEGNIVDYEVIRKRINEICKEYRVEGIGADPAFATDITTRLLNEDGLPIELVKQSFPVLNDPMMQFERAVQGKVMQHDGSPVLRWNVSNVDAKHNAAGLKMPDKSRRKNKIDGVSAILCALRLAIDCKEIKSVYEERGVRSL